MLFATKKVHSLLLVNSLVLAVARSEQKTLEMVVSRLDLAAYCILSMVQPRAV